MSLSYLIFATTLQELCCSYLNFQTKKLKHSGFFNLKSSWLTGSRTCIQTQPTMLLLFSLSVVSSSLWPHGLQHARLPCPSLSPRVCSNSCPLNRLCHPTIWSTVIPFSWPQSFPESESFPMDRLFASGGQSIGASAPASVLPMNIQGWFPLGSTGLIPLQYKGLSRVFFNATVQKHQFFSTQSFLLSSSHTHTWLLEKP